MLLPTPPTMEHAIVGGDGANNGIFSHLKDDEKYVKFC